MPSVKVVPMTPQVQTALSRYLAQAEQELDWFYEGGEKDAKQVATVLGAALLERSNALGWDTVICTGCTRVGEMPKGFQCCPDRKAVPLNTLVNGYEAREAQRRASYPGPIPLCTQCKHQGTNLHTPTCRACGKDKNLWERKA